MIVTILIIFYYTFLKEAKNQNTKTLTNIEKPEPEIDEQISNQLINIEYNSTDSEGNTFYINSKKATIDINNEKNNDMVVMEGVVAIINLKNKGPVFVSSKNAVYNKINHNTSFYNDVSIEYLDSMITSKNLDLLFTENISKVYNNVRFEGKDMKLYTDQVLIDMVNGDVKLEMKNNTEKVKFIKKNEFIN